MVLDETIRSALAAWSLPGIPVIERIDGGINSRTWRVESRGERFVAKLAWDTVAFVAGLEIAEYLESSGLRAGGPLRTQGGELSVTVGSQELALLRFVAGQPVDTSRASGLRVWGDTMGRTHSILLTIPRLPGGLRRWPWSWLDPAAEHLRNHEWVRAALALTLADVRELEATRQLTYGVLHGDGAPVRVAADGEPSVIDWGAAMWGPLLYDIASACWFFAYEAGRDRGAFEPFLRAYGSSGPLSPEELAGCETFVRLRCTVQAFYFAHRIANDIQVGLAGPSVNQEKLARARRAWARLSKPSWRGPGEAPSPR